MVAPYNAPPKSGVMSVTEVWGASRFAFAGFVYPNDQKTCREETGESHAEFQKADLYPDDGNLPEPSRFGAGNRGKHTRHRARFERRRRRGRKSYRVSNGNGARAHDRFRRARRICARRAPGRTLPPRGGG